LVKLQYCYDLVIHDGAFGQGAVVITTAQSGLYFTPCRPVQSNNHFNFPKKH